MKEILEGLPPRPVCDRLIAHYFNYNPLPRKSHRMIWKSQKRIELTLLGSESHTWSVIFATGTVHLAFERAMMNVELTFV